MGGQSRFTRDALEERLTVILRLEAQQVIVAQSFQQLFVRWNGGKNFRRRERNMQEETDAIVHTPFSQLAGKRKQVIIVDPQNIVFFDQWQQFVR
ncbi:hypothetical protein D3C87_1383790 [compost metagenome]